MLHFLPDQNQKLIRIKKRKNVGKIKMEGKKIISSVHLILVKNIK